MYPCVKLSLLFKADWHSIVWIYCILFIHLSHLSVHLDTGKPLAIMNLRISLNFSFSPSPCLQSVCVPPFSLISLSPPFPGASTLSFWPHLPDVPSTVAPPIPTFHLTELGIHLCSSTEAAFLKVTRCQVQDHLLRHFFICGSLLFLLQAPMVLPLLSFSTSFLPFTNGSMVSPFK